MTVGVGVGEDDDAAVTKASDIEILAQPAAERRHQVCKLLVLQHLRQRHALGVHDFPAKRKNRLFRSIASLLCRAACRITLDDEQLAVFTTGIRAIAQLSWQVQPARSEEHTSELQSLRHLVCRLLLEKKK